MSQGIVGFFAGGFVEDHNKQSQDPWPKHGDGKAKSASLSRYAGGSAANAAVTFGRLAELDSHNEGIAHLYTKSEKRTPVHLIQDLEKHNVHLKKLGLVAEVPKNTVYSWPDGGKFIDKGEVQELPDFGGQQDKILDLVSQLSEAAGESVPNVGCLERKLRDYFEGASVYLPYVSGNVWHQFQSDLQGSSIVMLDMNYPDLTYKVAQKAQEAGKTIMLDLGRWARHASVLIDMSDIIIASHDYRLDERIYLTPEEIRDYLVLNYEKSMVAVTRGSATTLCHRNGEEFEVDVPPADRMMSTSGSGDVMHGATAYFLARGEEFGRAIYLGNCVATLSVAFPDVRQFFNYIEFDHDGQMVIRDLDAPRDISEPEPAVT